MYDDSLLFFFFQEKLENMKRHRKRIRIRKKGDSYEKRKRKKKNDHANAQPLQAINPVISKSLSASVKGN